MFWTDVVQETINRALLNGSNVTTIISTGLKDPGEKFNDIKLMIYYDYVCTEVSLLIIIKFGQF